jgi:hypothetical protein
MASSELSKLIYDKSGINFKFIPFRDYFTSHSALKDEKDLNDTSVAEQFCWNTVAGLSQGKIYGRFKLQQLFESGYHPAFFGKEEKPSNNILTEKATYVLPRLVRKKDIGLLSEAEIHFTDNAADFYSGIKIEEVRTADKRSRNYRVDKDDAGRTHLTYLLRHSVEDNYIDAFELVSFLSFVEFYKKSIRENVFEVKDDKQIADLEKNIKALGFDFDDHRHQKKSIYIWANTGRGLSLTPSKKFSLHPPWETYDYKSANLDDELQTRDQDPVLDAVRTIKKEAQKKGLEIPEHLIYGNDFSVPLLLTLGLFKNEQIGRIFNLAPENVKKELEAEIKDLWTDEDKEVIRIFRAHQFLNQYKKGQSQELDDFKDTLDNTIKTFRHRIVNSGDTGLACPVDIIDFGAVKESLIRGINQKDLRKIFFSLKQKKSKILSMPYPLGDTVYPLTWLFNQKLGVKKIGFFGKVGSVVDERGNGIKRGRVVLPKYIARVGEFVKNSFQKIKNRMQPEDMVVIPKADLATLIMATNGVLSQTKEDILTIIELIKKFKIEPGTVIKVLLDSESWYLQKAFEDIEKELIKAGRMEYYRDPTIVYYVSDQTKVDGSVDEDMAKSLSGQGAVAALEAPISILKKWFNL